MQVVTPEERRLLLEAQPLRVRLVRTKGDVERHVRIPRELLQEIDAEYQAEGRVYLFESRYGRPFSRQYITREIARAGKRELGRRIGARMLRHSRATELYERIQGGQPWGSASSRRSTSPDT